MDFPPGQVLVQFQPNAPLYELKQIAEAVGGHLERELFPPGLYLLSFPEALPVLKVLDRLGAFSSVLYAEPNYRLEALSYTVDTTGTGAVAGHRAGLNKKVALLDTGFDQTHPETEHGWIRNMAEVPGDRLDNDGNRYIDDHRGFDFYDGNPDVRGEGWFKSHGTEVALACLRASENPEPSLLPLRVGPGPWLSTSLVCEALDYAMEQEAGVVVLSFGGWWASRSLSDIIREITDRQITVVASSGHNRWDLPERRALLPPVIWVAPSPIRGWKGWLFSEGPWRLSALKIPDLSNMARTGPWGWSLSNPHGAPTAAGKVGSAARFVADKGHLLKSKDRPDLSMGDVDFTVAAWVYLEKERESTLLAKADPRFPNAIEYLLRYNSNRKTFEFRVGDGSDSWSVYSTRFGAVSGRNWYWVAAWHQTNAAGLNTLSIQVNDGPIDTAPLPGGKSPADGTSEFTLGSFSETTEIDGTRLTGRLDEVGIWKKALTPEERTDLYRQGLGNRFHEVKRSFSVDPRGTLAKDLVAYFSFEEREGLWRFGRVTVAPFRIVGMLGLGLFFYSSIRGMTLLLQNDRG